MPRRIITLTTDFGLKDSYVAEMKAVILGICPDATIVDVTHEVEKFNVRMGAYALSCASQYFPKGSVHVAVVDPGVGTRRRPILIETEACYLVGPDNGLLMLAAKRLGIKHAYEITNRKLMLSPVSNTFHGRDVFAPAAAHLANGTPPMKFGSEIQRIIMPEFAKVVTRKDAVAGEVIYIDDFGNIITNLEEKELKSAKIGQILDIELRNARMKMKLYKAYADVAAHKPLAIVGSHNFLEFSINQGNAARTFKARIGDKVTLYRS